MDSKYIITPRSMKFVDEAECSTSNKSKRILHNTHKTESKQSVGDQVLITILNHDSQNISFKFFHESNTKTIEIKRENFIEEIILSLYCPGGKLIEEKTFEGVYSGFNLDCIKTDIFLLIIKQDDKEICSYKIEFNLSNTRKRSHTLDLNKPIHIMLKNPFLLTDFETNEV